MSKPFNLSSDIDSLINGCLKNDRRAQLVLYERYAKSMFNTCLRFIKDTMMAEDIVQESYISAYKSLDKFRNEVPFAVWLRRIVINKSLDHLRNRKNFPDELNNEITIAYEYDSHEKSEEDEQIKKEQLKQISDSVMKMPDGYRIIFSLYYYEGFDHDEIAGILNISASTSRSQLTRAKQNLRKKLNYKDYLHE